jgi:hypothetical protein
MSVVSVIPDDFTYNNDGVALAHVEALRDMAPMEVEAVEKFTQQVSTDWGLFPLGYHLLTRYLGGNAVGSHCWTATENQNDEAPCIYLNIFQEPEQNVGRITLVGITATHKHCWTNSITGEVVDRVYRSLIHVPGVTIWTRPYTNQTEFLENLRTAHILLRDEERLLALAALIPTALP